MVQQKTTPKIISPLLTVFWEQPLHSLSMLFSAHFLAQPFSQILATEHVVKHYFFLYFLIFPLHRSKGPLLSKSPAHIILYS